MEFEKSGNVCLEELGLYKNNLSDNEIILSGLTFVKTLKRVNLRNNKFSNESAQLILQKLPAEITQLNLESNLIDESIIALIQQKIKNNTDEEDIRKRAQFSSFGHCGAGFGKRTI